MEVTISKWIFCLMSVLSGFGTLSLAAIYLVLTGDIKIG